MGKPTTVTTQPVEPSDTVTAKFTGPLKDLHATLVATRNLEIGLFWQRANYFLVLNSGLAIGYFNLKDTRYAPLFAVVGVVASVLWFRVCMGGKYWQTRWEQRLMDFEAHNFKQLAFFSADKERLRNDVSRGLAFQEEKGPKAFLYKRIAGHKPSVSFSMFLLAGLFAAVWAVLLVIVLFG
jgi:hypothetical protein